MLSLSQYIMETTVDYYDFCEHVVGDQMTQTELQIGHNIPIHNQKILS